MRLSVVGWSLPKFEAFAKCLKDLSSLIGEEVVTLSGQKDAGFVTLTTLKQYDERPAKSDKSSDSPHPASLPWMSLQVQRTREDGDVVVHVSFVDKTGRLVDVASSYVKEVVKLFPPGTSIFTVDTSRKPTSTDTTYSKAELLMLLRKRGEMNLLDKDAIEVFINGL